MAKFKVAAAHIAPVFMDKQATIGKVIDLIKDASKKDVELLVFPEVFVPGYPHFQVAYAPLAYFETVLDYAEQSFLVFEPESVRSGAPKPSADLLPILEICKETRINLVLGVSEKSSFSAQTLFNSQVFVSKDGQLLGVHRKLVPTFCERSFWAHGGGATLRCWDAPTRDGSTFRISGLACGENMNYGAKLSLIQEGQQIHAASWPAQCAISGMEETWKDIKLLAQSHSKCAMCFTICASSIVSGDELKWSKEKLGEQNLVKIGSGWSGIVGPTGETLAEDAGGLEEKLLVAEIDLDSIPSAKLMNDPAGHYARPEVLNLTVNRQPVWEDDKFVAGGRV